MHVKGSPSFERPYDPKKTSGSLLRYTQSIYLVGPGGLVISPEVSGSSREVLGAVLKSRSESDVEQLFEMTRDSRLINGAGYCLEVCETGLKSSKIRLRKVTPGETVTVNQQWKFEQERIVSRIPSMPLPGSPDRSSHLVLEALYDETRPAMPGTPVVLGVACQVGRGREVKTVVTFL